MISNLEKKFEEILIYNKINFKKKNNLLGTPDFIIEDYKTLIFVDGCFWHFCEKHFKLPKSNQNFWINKRKKTIRRDKYITEILKNDGWKVLRIWEHQIKDNKLSLNYLNDRK